MGKPQLLFPSYINLYLVISNYDIFSLTKKEREREMILLSIEILFALNEMRAPLAKFRFLVIVL